MRAPEDPAAADDPETEPPAAERMRILGEPPLDLLLHRPAGVARGAPLLVAVHGTAVDPDKQIGHWAPVAQYLGAALAAPKFDAPPYADFQRLGRREARADLALDRAIDSLRGAGIVGREVYLAGHSGGAQFTHRYALTRPERVAGLIAVGAGWYTFPDPERRYPYGLRLRGRLPGLRIDLAGFLQVPVMVAVGADDVKRGRRLRSSPRLDREQGRDRLERAERWGRALADAAVQRGLPVRIELVKLPGAGHSLSECMAAGLAEHVARFFAEQRAGRQAQGPR